MQAVRQKLAHRSLRSSSDSRRISSQKSGMNLNLKFLFESDFFKQEPGLKPLKIEPSIITGGVQSCCLETPVATTSDSSRTRTSETFSPSIFATFAFDRTKVS